MVKEFTVFVLDDDEPFCDLLSVLAMRHDLNVGVEGYKIVLKTYHDMSNLPGAITWVKENKPDLVLLDYMLGDGLNSCLLALDVLKELIPHCKSIKILTGLSSEDLRLKLVKEGLDKMNIEVIQKPFGVDRLLQMLKDALQVKENV